YFQSQRDVLLRRTRRPTSDERLAELKKICDHEEAKSIEALLTKADEAQAKLSYDLIQACAPVVQEAADVSLESILESLWFTSAEYAERTLVNACVKPNRLPKIMSYLRENSLASEEVLKMWEIDKERKRGLRRELTADGGELEVPEDELWKFYFRERGKPRGALRAAGRYRRSVVRASDLPQRPSAPTDLPSAITHAVPAKLPPL
ncbi:MAG TPA: hypothetical protein VIV60_16615, partial [Polyangiaceae bacterium]